jgi:hypothetical protein
MKTDIILAGVGGQGILSIAASLGAAALNENYHLKQAETHGMSQRGGAVVSHLRIADHPIFSDLIPAVVPILYFRLSQWNRCGTCRTSQKREAWLPIQRHLLTFPTTLNSRKHLKNSPVKSTSSELMPIVLPKRLAIQKPQIW